MVIYLDKFVGRLGNQLFQIASTIGLARLKGLEPRLPVWDYAPVFSIPEALFESYDDELRMNVTDCAVELDERERIYLQNVQYFDHVKDEIRQIFSPSLAAQEIIRPSTEVLKEISRDNSILSLHVRRGDILSHPEYHPVRSIQYYADALKEVSNYGSVAVFSDDVDWCARVLAPKLDLNVSFYGSGVSRSPMPDQYEKDGPIDWQDLFLMNMCSSHIISNSTYAWWGAYLSEDDHPVYPSNWFGRELREQARPKLLFPSSWKQVHDPTQGGI
jgi:hypothetical protein